MIVALVALAAFGSGAAPPARAALSVSPAHVTLAAGSTAKVRVRATPGARLVLRASVAGLALDGQGRPKITVARDAALWLTVTPRTILVGRAGARVLIASRPNPHARPGDHTAVVVLTAVPSAANAVAVGIRVGLVVRIRVAGRVTHRVEVVAAHAARARILVTVANRGDVIEQVGGTRVLITLLRRGRILAHASIARRMLLPHSRAVFGFRMRPTIHGRVVARIVLPRPGGGTAARSFPLRL